MKEMLTLQINEPVVLKIFGRKLSHVKENKVEKGRELNEGFTEMNKWRVK